MTTISATLRRVTRIGPRKATGLAGVSVWTAGATVAGLPLPVVSAVAGLAIAVLATALAVLEWRRHRPAAPNRGGPPSAADSASPPGTAGDCAVPNDLPHSFVTLNRLERRLAAANEQLIRGGRALDEDAAWKDVVLAVRAEGEPARTTQLWAFPRAANNSYQPLLYQEFPRFDLQVRYPPSLDEVGDLPRGSILHLHWTRFVQANAETMREAQRRSDDVMRRIAVMREHGASLVWSVHERLPHDCRFPEVESRFRQQLADSADVIHVLHDATAEFVADTYLLDPDRCVTVPHPLYTGVTPDHVSREAARATLGLRDSDLMILCLGAIRPYKGFERVLDILPHVRDQFPDRRVRLVIAGVALDTDPTVRGYISMLRERASTTPGVSVVPGTVPERDVHVLFNAADTTVYPYRAGLNSGALFLSLTFGVPAVIHRNPVTADLESVGPVHAVDCEEADALASAVVESLKWDRSAIRLDASFVRAHLPEAVSRQMAEALRDRLHLSS